MTKGFKVDGFFIPKSYDKNNDSKLQVTELNIWCKQNDLKYDSKTKKIVSAVGDYLEDDINNKLDSNKYSLENIKKRYPAEKYNITEDYIGIHVTDKSTGKDILIVSTDKEGTYITMYDKNGQNEYFRNYDSNGQLLFYDNDGKSHCPIADNIYQAVSAKNKCKLPTTDVNKLVMNVKKLTPENIGILYNEYKKQYGESLIEAIEGEWGLDDNIKKSLISHINKCLYDAMQKTYTKPNCKIDKSFYQGQKGDCWFLSTIAAIQRSPKGQEILDNMITDNKDGTYTVKFKGAKDPITVSVSELQDKSDWARGDLDVRILEVAADKYYYITGINGGNPASAMDLLLGQGGNLKNQLRLISGKPDKKELKNLLNNPNIIMVTSTSTINSWFNKPSDDADYTSDFSSSSHAYAISRIDDNNIYIINPWHSYHEIAIPLDEFDDYWNSVQYTEIK